MGRYEVFQFFMQTLPESFFNRVVKPARSDAPRFRVNSLKRSIFFFCFIFKKRTTVFFRTQTALPVGVNHGESAFPARNFPLKRDKATWSEHFCDIRLMEPDDG